MTKITKNVSVMCFQDELCQVYYALMISLSPLKAVVEKKVNISINIDNLKNGIIFYVYSTAVQKL
ncbi:MAG: hypothetical protein AB1632_07120 [Nitrospirota bacterium]